MLSERRCTMKKSIIILLILSLCPCYVLATEKKTIRDSKGNVIGYTRTYNNGKTVQYDKNWSVQNYYKINSNGTVRKYSKHYEYLGKYQK